jgi:SSS family solute:Na+ symporter
VIAIVVVGLFTTRVPAIGPKVAIAFHVIAYGLFQFLLNDYLNIHFLHLYAILFFAEVGIMLGFGHFRPAVRSWDFQPHNMVDLTPWRFARPCAVTLMSCVVGLYLLFSPIGLVGGIGPLFRPLLGVLVMVNILAWWWSIRVAAPAPDVVPSLKSSESSHG